MRVISEELMAEACRLNDISRPGLATIMECSRLSAFLEKQTGIPFIHMELGSPGFAPNRVGVEAEKAALDSGIGSKYSPADGLPVLKEASSLPSAIRAWTAPPWSKSYSPTALAP